MAAELGQINHETRAAIEGIRGDKGSRLTAGRDIDPGEIAALMKACANDQTPAGARDASMIALMASTGMRRAEVAALKLSDMREGGEIHVTGKGNKQRKVFIVNGTARAMADWLTIRGTSDECVFCAINKAGVVDTRRSMTPQILNNMLEKRCEQAGIENLTPHDFRRTLAGALLDNGNDIATVARLLGHSSVTTTQRYDRRGDESVRRAAQGVSVPYYGRNTNN
jgi:site-specific recombinase XerD